MTQDNQDDGTARPFSGLAKICGIRVIYDKQDLLAAFAKGLYDLPVPVDCGLTGDQHRTGLLAMAGPFRADDFERALILTGSGGVVESRECMIDPKFILAQAWQPDRLANARKRVAKDLESYPARLSGIRFPGLPEFYTVTDGMHRTVAARLAGKEAIQADVSGYTICDPERYEIKGGMVVNPERPSPWPHVENETVLTILASLGVREAVSLHQKLIRPIVSRMIKPR